ncbi:MAG TPA: heavy-metal-associated domain-containing protein [Anaerolineae bacterium]
MANIETTKMKVVGPRIMHCGGCANTVEFVLRELEGVHRVDANHRTQQIELAYDPEALDFARVRRELDQLDYQVERIG